MGLALYIASALGAVAVYLMMPRRGFNPGAIGAAMGAIVLGGLWVYLSPNWPDSFGAEFAQQIYFYVFSALAIGSAVRVITHTRPVYAALWFVMVVLASSGLLLVLQAEFMAFAMVIIYAGAILVTYVFVIMLATPPESAGQDGGSSQAAGGAVTDYDRVAHEPVAAVAAGFLLLGVLSGAMFEPFEANTLAAGPADDVLLSEVLVERPVNRLIEQEPDQGERESLAAVTASGVSNTERVGVDLFSGHPLGLELAGVILLVSLVGAVVIARHRVSEDQENSESVAVSS